MNRKQLLIVSIIVAIVLAVIVVLLVTGGAAPENSTEDATGDVVVSEGDSPPEDVALADIVDASVSEEGGQIVLEATMATSIP